MGKHAKLLLRILRGSSDATIPFEGLCGLLQSLGFDLRIKGSHHIFTRDDVDEILNLQPRNNLAKPYQVKQVRNVIVKYKLGDDEDNDEV
ncbi:MAG: type II toxin-antitoxin system HicA family toxin [Anaerolineae bacterium]|nr:type II toxin-antitoxin system HicA family toxin [Anaerolineae bacterium]